MKPVKFTDTRKKLDFEYDMPKGQELYLNTTIARAPNSDGILNAHLRVSSNVEETRMKGVIDNTNVDGMKALRDFLRNMANVIDKEISEVESTEYKVVENIHIDDSDWLPVNEDLIKCIEDTGGRVAVRGRFWERGEEVIVVLDAHSLIEYSEILYHDEYEKEHPYIELGCMEPIYNGDQGGGERFLMIGHEWKKLGEV